MRNFSATPVKETPEEESALQAIPLQEKNCLWEETCDNDTAEAVKAGYYFYLNASERKFLVCKVRVYPEVMKRLTAEKIHNFVERVYVAGMKLEQYYKILPEYIRADENESYCFRRMSNKIGCFLTEIHEDVVKSEKSEEKATPRRCSEEERECLK